MAMQMRTLPRQHNMRALLRAIGVGDFNATMVIPYMFFSPRATDPAAPQIIILTKALQKSIIAMGAPIHVTGVLDDDMANALDVIGSPEWLDDTWGNLVEDVVAAQQNGYQYPQPVVVVPPAVQPTGLAGALDFLPDVPGGMLTYGVAAYFLYRYLQKRKAI